MHIHSGGWQLVWNMSGGELSISVGDVFENKASFRNVVTNLGVQSMRKIVYPVNDKVRIKAACKDRSCCFCVHGRIDHEGTVRVSSCEPKHTCSITIGNVANGKWLAGVAETVLQYQPNAGGADLMRRAKIDHGLDVPYQTAHNIISKVKHQHIHSGDSSYGLIAPWLMSIRDINPGTIIDFERDTDRRITRLFLSCGAWRNAFASTLPILCLDAAHLKCKEGGVVFVASTISGNKDVCIVAFAFGNVEDGANWSWFLRNLIRDENFIDRNDVVVMSDREKGLHNAVSSILPTLPHSFCVVHLKKNVKTYYKTELKGNIYKLAKCLEQRLIDEMILECRFINEEATEYLLGTY